MKTVLVVVLAILLQACGAEDPPAEPAPPPFASGNVTKGVYDVATLCSRICVANGEPAGEWCRCSGYSSMACVCRTLDQAACSYPGCEVP